MLFLVSRGHGETSYKLSPLQGIRSDVTTPVISLERAPGPRTATLPGAVRRKTPHPFGKTQPQLSTWHLKNQYLYFYIILLVI